MKHILKYSLGCLVLAAFSLGVFSCSDDDFSDIPSAIYPSSVELDIPEELQPYVYYDSQLEINVLPMLKGESVTLGYNLYPENITFNEVVWSSSDESVATVDGGKVDAISGDGAGYTIIQVSPDPSYSGSNIFATLKVDVSNTLIPAQSITVSSADDEEEVFVGETLQLSASILPENATYKTVKWSSSDESIATVDMKGVVTGKESSGTSTTVTITATSLDGAQITGSKQIIVKQIVKPEEVIIDQSYSVDNGYLFAIADKSVTLNYTTVPAISTTSLIEWTSSDESIATVDGGLVIFNQEGVFGDVTITATCPETSNNSSLKLRLEEGLVRELFHDQNNYNWYNAVQSGNNTESSHVWSYGKVTITTYTQDAAKQRADFRCWSPKTWLHAGNYPIFAIRMDDVMDLYEPVTARNITFDASGSSNDQAYSGGLDGNNNKWLHDYKCSDGSHVFIYSLTEQSWATGGKLPTNAIATFGTLQFKYADIATLTQQVTYNVYWVQTFKTIDDVKSYIESEGLTYEIIK